LQGKPLTETIRVGLDGDVGICENSIGVRKGDRVEFGGDGGGWGEYSRRGERTGGGDAPRERLSGVGSRESEEGRGQSFSDVVLEAVIGSCADLSLVA